MSQVPSNTTLVSRDYCTPVVAAPHFQAAWSICKFFAINIIAHCLTMRGSHGQPLTVTAYRAFAMIIGPVIAGEESFTRLIAFLIAAKRAYTSDRTSTSAIGRLWRLRKIVIVDFSMALEKACNAGAVAIYVLNLYRKDAESLGWRCGNFAPCQCLTMSGRVVNELDGLNTVPFMAKVTETGKERVIIPQTSAIQTIVAFFQVFYSSVELFGSHWPMIRQLGLSSPYLLVIPYAFMSLVNLLVNALIPSYSCVTVLDPICSNVDEQLAAAKQSQSGESTCETQSPMPQGARVSSQSEDTFIEWVEMTYGLTGLRQCPSNSSFKEWGRKFSAFFCPAFITVILLAATRCHFQDVGQALAYLAWIYVGNIFTAILLATGFRTVTEDMVDFGAFVCGLTATIVGAIVAGRQLYPIFLMCP